MLRPLSPFMAMAGVFVVCVMNGPRPMTEVNNIHDTFFRETMSHKEVAADFLANYLPAKVLKHIRLDTLTITKDSFVDEKLDEYYSDLLYHVTFTGNRLGLIYFLFEHKSFPDRFTDLQLLGYLSENWQLVRKQFPKAKKLPLIIPIIVYHGKPKGKAVRLADLIDLPHPDLACYVPTFDTAFYDFSPGADEEIKGDIYIQLILHCLRAKNIPKSREILIHILLLLAQLPEDATSMHWIQKIFRYLSQVMDIERGVVHDLVKENVPLNMEGKIMTIAEQWKQDGRIEGRQAIIQRQIAKRFGKSITDMDIQERLRKATPEQLDLWAERILDAKNVDEVFKDN
ncbi:MAG: Rpn family recombination-promoting nuclease/putative transposase [Desulfovibrionales bacterium]|nr:MAG: Rpn family recombination-promoting nuclease/putative transposase [Desulfovibrionales bacterium]